MLMPGVSYRHDRQIAAQSMTKSSAAEWWQRDAAELAREPASRALAPL